MILNYPPGLVKFVVQKQYLSPLWKQWFIELDQKLDLRDGKLSFDGNKIVNGQTRCVNWENDTGIWGQDPDDIWDIVDIINLQATNDLTLNFKVWNNPASSSLQLTVNDDQLEWDEVHILEDVRAGTVRPIASATIPDDWLALDDGTVGNEQSGATSFAHEDAYPLYYALWTNCSNTACPVSTGRGLSALDDFNAGKTIGLPLNLGRAVKGSPTISQVGEISGSETVSMTHAMTSEHEHTIPAKLNVGGIGLTPTEFVASEAEVILGVTTYDIDYTIDGATDIQGSGDAQNIIQPTSYAATLMIKK